MKKEISKREKMEFFKKFHERDFYEYYRNLGRRSCQISFWALTLLSFGTMFCGMFNPWLLLGLIPAIGVPCLFIFDAHKKRKHAIESLTENITYKDYQEMLNSNEWQMIAEDHCDRVLTEIRKARNNKTTFNNIEKKTSTLTEDNKMDLSI